MELRIRKKYLDRVYFFKESKTFFEEKKNLYFFTFLNSVVECGAEIKLPLGDEITNSGSFLFTTDLKKSLKKLF
jgi:hypothetical protein